VVPNVVGKTLAKAKSKLAHSHCRLGKVTRKISSQKAKGRVLSERPKPRTRLATGARVRLTVGKGPKR